MRLAEIGLHHFLFLFNILSKLYFLCDAILVCQKCHDGFHRRIFISSFKRNQNFDIYMVMFRDKSIGRIYFALLVSILLALSLQWIHSRSARVKYFAAWLETLL